MRINPDAAWCPTCGKDSDGNDCPSCAQWWLDNPPPVANQSTDCECANCHGMIGKLSEGRDPEELCDTCYNDMQATDRK